MKILKIESSKGYYSIDGKNWSPIDVINKEDLLIIVNTILKQDVDIDEFNASKIDNQSHQIIYKSIYEKVLALVLDKNKFKDESERLYLKEIEKYKTEA